VQVLVSIVVWVAGTSLAFGQIEQYQKQLADNPRDPLAHLRIGEILLSENNLEGAASAFRSAIEGESAADWVVEIARAHLQTIAKVTRPAELAIQPAAPVGEVFARVQAEYSDEARVAGLEGIIVVSGTLADDGSLSGARVERPLGLGLDEKAMEAAAQWRNSAELLSTGTAVRIAVDFTLPEKRSRWHLTNVEFTLEEGVTRPQFARVPYPIGSGIAREAVDQGRFVIAVGRSAVAKVSFDIGPQGKASNFRIVGQSEQTWGPQAVGFVSQWEFLPGTQEGVPVTVPCTVTLVWGERSIPAQVLAHAGVVQ